MNTENKIYTSIFYNIDVLKKINKYIFKEKTCVVCGGRVDIFKV